MMTTRPGYIWSGTEWVAIGQQAAVNPFKYQASAPTSPATGDIWVDSDDDVPSIDSAQFLRWRRIVSGGQTSLSGADDLSLPLQYTPGYEQLYINGVLQVRNLDYVATTGTTVTGLLPLALNDVVEIFSVVARLVGDVYTQAQADARYALGTNVYTQAQSDARYALGGGSIVGGTYTAGAILGTGYATYITVNLQSNGRPVLVNFSGTYNNANSGANRNVSLRAQLDGVTIGNEITGLLSLFVSGSATPTTSSHSFVVTPTVGSRSFTFQALCLSAGSVGLAFAQLSLIQI